MKIIKQLNKFLELKITLGEIKNPFKGLNSRLR